MRDVRLKESDPLGLFFTTDSPAINAILHSPEALEVLRVNGTEVLSTVGSFGNVKFSNTGVCDDASSDSCVASDPRSAWLKSMVDMTLLGETDVELLLYSSKFADAALMRSIKVKRGRVHLRRHADNAPTDRSFSLENPKAKPERGGLESFGGYCGITLVRAANGKT